MKTKKKCEKQSIGESVSVDSPSIEWSVMIINDFNGIHKDDMSKYSPRKVNF